MNKTKKIFIMLIMIYMICTIFVTSFAKNETNYEGKGTVSLLSVDKDGKVLDKSTWGTAENPYQLVLGEPIIDIYYGDYADAIENGGIHFEFTSGKYNAANYIVENNVDKGRLRFKLQGTTEDYLKVTSQKGLNYLQAGAMCYLPDFLKKSGDGFDEIGYTIIDEMHGDVQTPYYTIIGKHSVKRLYDGKELDDHETFNLEPALGNSFLLTDDTMLSNLSTYSTSYVFAKSNLEVNETFKLSEEQKNKLNILKINYGADYYASFTFIDGDDLTKIDEWEIGEYEYWAGDKYYEAEPRVNFELVGPVKVVYCFKGTNSEILDMDRETPPIESVLSKLCLSIIDGITKVAKLGGKDGKYYVTIDSLVFNEYPNTIVDFWGGTNYLNGKAKPMINFWFNVFKAWAIAMYIFLLIYIGIKTMIVSGTSEQKKVKSMFEGWLVGVLMMFCFPFLFKYLIVINDMVVDIIRTNSKYSVYAYYTFENMYTKWGQEDGENSTTSVIDRLRKAAEQLKQDIDSQEELVAIKNEELLNAQKAKEDFLASEDWAFVETDIEESRNNMQDAVNYVIYERNGEVITPNEIETDLVNILSSLYNNDEIVQEYIKNDKTPDKVWNELNNYYDDIKIYDKNNGQELIVGDTRYGVFIQRIKSLGIDLNLKYAFPAVLESIEQELQSKIDELENLKKDLENVEYALVKAESNQADILGEMHVRVEEDGKFMYVIILAIMFFEVIILLFLYYKRLFMIAILIAIFPLITVAYVFEKSKDGKAKIMQTWLQEYTLNVFIQTVHAILYVTLVEVGYAVFIDNHDNVIIFIVAVVSLISAEPVFKNILGLKGSTVSDLAKHGASMGKVLLATGALTSTVLSTPADLKNIDKKDKKATEKTNAKREKQDKREDTLRRANENRINKNDKLTDEEKKKKIDNWNKVYNTTDRAKEAIRKKRDAIKRYQKNAKKIARVTANATSVLTTIAGGTAAGGELGDYIAAANVSKTLTGTGQKFGKDDKVKVDNKVNNVSTENDNTPNGYKPRYTGSGYEGFNPNGSGNARNAYASGANGIDDNSNYPEKSEPKVQPKLRKPIAQRLEQEKARVNIDKNYTERQENR